MKYQHKPLQVNWKISSYGILRSYLILVVVRHGWLESQIFKKGAEMLSSAYSLLFQQATCKCFSYFYHFLYSSVVVAPRIWTCQGSGKMPRKGNFDITYQSEEKLKQGTTLQKQDSVRPKFGNWEQFPDCENKVKNNRIEASKSNVIKELSTAKEKIIKHWLNNLSL